MEAEQDIVRMCFFSSNDKPYPGGYAATGSWYWLASRKVDEHSYGVGFTVRTVDSRRKCICP